MVPTKRLFLALVLPDEAKARLNTWRNRNLYTLEQPPVPVDNYHVTLVYIGAVTQPQLIELRKQLGTVVADSFVLDINKTDYWPTPKVLHLMPTSIPPRLIDLQRKVNKATTQAGLPPETRPYRPHITLYRKIKPIQFEQLEQDGLPEPNTSIAINQFAIYESISSPNGVYYKKLDSYGLIGSGFTHNSF